MPTHDIIDNRSHKLVDHINSILSSTNEARFAVGYLFISGLVPITQKLAGLKELRLLIGNTTNRQTLEQLAEGYRRLEMVAETAEAMAYPKRSDAKRMVIETAENLRNSIEMMEPSDASQALICQLVQMIEEGRLKVRVYTKGRMHAKGYIFDYGPVFNSDGDAIDRHEKGIAIVGSSNLTLAGVTHNTELNVVVQGNDNHRELVRWFDDLWNEAQDFDETLMLEMKKSWAVAQVRPYDIFMKTLYVLVKDRLEDGDDQDVLWDDEITGKLADFQKVAVKQAVQMIRDFGGAFVADVVGLGKSYIGAAIVKHFERTEHARPLVVCPAPLVEMWEHYNEAYQLNARVLSLGYLREQKEDNWNLLLEDVKFRDRDFVLIDESHNFRHSDTQRYKVMQAFTATGRRCCLLTATPRNKSAWDVYHQIKLFHVEDKTDLPIDPPDLKEYFKLVERNDRTLKGVLQHILIRRLRNHIIRWYGYDAQTHQPIDPSSFSEYMDGTRKAYVMVAGRHQFFPKRELETIEYSIEDTYQGLYQEIRKHLGKPRQGQLSVVDGDELTYARYGLWHYVRPGKLHREPYASLQRAGANLCGLIRLMLFKRFESSVFAFQQTVERLLKVHDRFLKALDAGIVPAGDEAKDILYETDEIEEADLLDALRGTSSRYLADDFDLQKLRSHIQCDIRIYQTILKLVRPITPDKDAKLQTLRERLGKKPFSQGKVLIFTQYADTARYLFENLRYDRKVNDIDVIYSGDKNKALAVARFAPKANPEYQYLDSHTELNVLIATDVLAEGLNLQDCDKIVNYDLHWNPVRLIQRFGRIDRIGSEHEVVYGFNFLPEVGIELNLGLKQILHNRVQEIHETIGEDAAILDETERLNTEAMYAIYEMKGNQLSLFEDEDSEVLDLSEAEEIIRQLRQNDPAEFDRIASLRDGIRSAKGSKDKGIYVFCQAGRFQQLFLADENGEVVTRDIPGVLGTIKCGSSEPSVELSVNFNKAVARTMRRFVEEVKHRESERRHTTSLSMGQRYVLRELRIIFSLTGDEDVKARINLLEKTFRGPITAAVNRELNRMRRNGLVGQNLLKVMSSLYLQHGMRDWAERRQDVSDDHADARIICAEGLL